ncbi:MAG: GGDEF domain-containing protein [Phycisphaerales bacterium]
MLRTAETTPGPLRAVLGLLEGLHQGTIVGLGVALLAGVASLDEAVGPHAPFSLFYVVPVALVTWYVSGQWGLLFSVFAGVVTFALAYRTIPASAPTLNVIWLLFAKIAAFALVGGLIYVLKSSQELQRNLANTDHLTGIANSRALRAAAAIEVARCTREAMPITAVFLDCDNFKTVNDRNGHAGGDRLLQEVARTLAENIRQTDVVGRVGGDEFAVVLPGVGMADAKPVVEKLQSALQAAMVRSQWPVTFSIGAATFERAPESVEELLARSDAMQYAAKTNGKNRIVFEHVPAALPKLAA